METYEKRFWQDLLDKVLQCENFSQCLFGKINTSSCFITEPEKYCETPCFKNLLFDWSPEFFLFYQNKVEETKKAADSLFSHDSCQSEELCFFYLTILGIAVFFSSPRISQRTRPIFSEKSFKNTSADSDTENNKISGELLEKFQKFTGDDAIKDFAAEINTALEHLSPSDSTRSRILLVLKLLADGFNNSLLPVQELNLKDKEKLLDDVLIFLKEKRGNADGGKK